MIGEYLDSPIRCRCGKRMVMDLGQDLDTGWVHEHHSCLDCGAEVRERPWPHKTHTVVEILAARSRHLDRGRLVVDWLGTKTAGEVEQLAERGEN